MRPDMLQAELFGTQLRRFMDALGVPRTPAAGALLLSIIEQTGLPPEAQVAAARGELLAHFRALLAEEREER
ncbi:MAG: hypothetical protein WA484_10320 [Solirubrobacteraceae bacterium]